MDNPVSEHRVARLFPDMPAEAYALLYDDIAAHGLKVPILFWNGQLIDGRHRLQACLALGIEPRSEDVGHLPEEELGDLVWSLNSTRRHLTPGQRAMVAALMSRLSKEGRPKKAQETAPDGAVSTPTQDRAAKRQGVSRRQTQRAVKVLREAPDLAKEIHGGGKLTLSKALQEIDERKAPPVDPARTDQNFIYRELLQKAISGAERLRLMLVRATTHSRPESRERLPECDPVDPEDGPVVTDAVAYKLGGDLKALLERIYMLGTKLPGGRVVVVDLMRCSGALEPPQVQP